MRTIAAAAMALFAGLALPMFAQSGGTDTLSALLAEVRQLRLAMERAATTTPQIQLLSARLTVQNERLTRAARDLDTTRQELERMSVGTAGSASRLTELEEMVSRELDAARHRQLVQEHRDVKRQAEQMVVREQQLRAREAELANVASAELGSWTDLNKRLDELERELAARRPR